jgi:hypothetical protein
MQLAEATTAYLGRDYPTSWDIDAFGTVKMSLEESTHYQMVTIDSDDEWAALYPGNGIIYLGEQKQAFSISMFHQLRCLDIIRKEIVRTFNTSTQPPAITAHCINYLRQTVLCRADIYISPVLAFPKPKPKPDTFVCKDWEEVYKAVYHNQEHRHTRN